MSKVRTRLIYNGIIAKAFHPSRVSKLLDEHTRNGGDICDFEI